jgi:hypothetical protein
MERIEGSVSRPADGRAKLQPDRRLSTICATETHPKDPAVGNCFLGASADIE